VVVDHPGEEGRVAQVDDLRLPRFAGQLVRRPHFLDALPHDQHRLPLPRLVGPAIDEAGRLIKTGFGGAIVCGVSRGAWANAGKDSATAM